MEYFIRVPIAFASVRYLNCWELSKLSILFKFSKAKCGQIALDSQYSYKTVIISRSPILYIWVMMRTTGKCLSKPPGWSFANSNQMVQRGDRKIIFLFCRGHLYLNLLYLVKSVLRRIILCEKTLSHWCPRNILAPILAERGPAKNLGSHLEPSSLLR